MSHREMFFRVLIVLIIMFAVFWPRHGGGPPWRLW